jgi:hypothetical protein
LSGCAGRADRGGDFGWLAGIVSPFIDSTRSSTGIFGVTLT